eukprot:COSAG05_NODE_1617_length_4393_cov_5.095249_3_plen_85_part_00
MEPISGHLEQILLSSEQGLDALAAAAAAADGGGGGVLELSPDNAKAVAAMGMEAWQQSYDMDGAWATQLAAYRCERVTPPLSVL